MIDKALETLLTAFFTLMISIGVGVTLLWAGKSIKQSCSKINCCKRNRWICEYCGDIVHSTTQPYCKECCHVQRKDVKMFKIKR